MVRNVGQADRLIRAAVGVVLIAFAVFSEAAFFEAILTKAIFSLVGAVLIVVAGLGVCPIYSVLGIKTCKV